MKSLRAHTAGSFYGVAAPAVEGLDGEVRHGVRKGRPYSYLVFRDRRGIKWKIVPSLSSRGRVHSLGLYHRNAYGRRGFHSQAHRAWGTPKGVRELVLRIEEHEEYERRKQAE